MFNPYSRENTALLGGLASFLSQGQVGTVATEQGMSPRCEFEGAKARRIVLPDASTLPPGYTLGAIRGLMDHESAHARYTQSGWFGEPHAGFERMALNAIEDVRIERLMSKALPGAKRNIEELNRVGWERVREGIASAQAQGAAPVEPAMLVLMALCQKTQGLEPEDLLYDVAPPKDVAGAITVAEQLLPLATSATRARTTEACWEQVQKIIAAIQDPQPPPPPSKGKGKGQPDKGDGEPQKGQGGGGEGQDQDQDSQDQGDGQGQGQEDEGEGQGGEGEGQDDGEGEGEQDADDFAQRAAQSVSDMQGTAQRMPNPADQVEQAVGGKPDGDDSGSKAGADAVNLDNIDLKAALRDPIYYISPAMKAKDKANITKLGPARPDAYATGTLDTGSYDDLRSQMAPNIAAIRQTMRMKILAEGRTRIHPEREEGEVDRNRLWALASGASDRVFCEVQKGRSKRTTVTMLVDQSGSMSGEEIIQARATACAIAEAMNGLPGVTLEVIGFTTEYAGLSDESARVRALKFEIAKEANQRDCSSIINMTKASGTTPTGESIRFAAQRMLARPANRRIILVLTDGIPEVVDNESAVDDIIVAIQARRHSFCQDVSMADAVVACRVCRKVGIDVIGIGIGTDVDKVFGPDHSVNDVNPSDLSGVALKALASALDKATHRNR